MAIGDRIEDTGWFEVSDEEGRTAALHPIATIVSGGRVYSLMGAVRRNDEGEDEGGLVLVRQSRLAHEEGTRYEVVGDDQEIEQVMSRVLAAILEEGMSQSEDELDLFGQAEDCGVAHGDAGNCRQFCACGIDELLQ